MPSEKDNNSKTISSIPHSDINKNQNIRSRSNYNKFDWITGFDPEKLEKLAMKEISNPGDDFNFGDEVVNPYEDDTENKKKKMI